MSGSITAEQFAADLNLVAPAPAATPTPVPQFAPYTTGPADRWDLIAWRAYGDPTQIAPIIAANPTVAISPVLPQGITVFCPLITPPAPAANTLPWSP